MITPPCPDMSPPFNPSVFPHLTLLLMAMGLFFTAWFFVLSGWFSPLVHFCIVWTLFFFKGVLYQVYQGDYEGVGHLCS